MSPTATKRRPTANDNTTTMDAMADAIARKRADDLQVRQRHLDAYRRAVELEAKREPIPSEVADAALSAASALGIPPGRLAADAEVVRQALSLDVHEHRLGEEMASWDGRALKERRRELVDELRRVDATFAAASALGFRKAGIADQRRQLRARSPHLFASAAELTPAEWNHIRAEG